jgi:oleandomycin transport system ATP-binding protein
VTPARRGDVDAVTALLAARLGTTPEVSAESGTVSAAVEGGRLLPEIVRELDAADIELAEFALRKASLDEVFLALTGQPADPTDPTDPSPAPELPELNGSAR